jgi:hypothetical protein
VAWTRHDFNANVTMQDLVDSYMPAFQSCVEKGRVSGLMCSCERRGGCDHLLKIATLLINGL